MPVARAITPTIFVVIHSYLANIRDIPTALIRAGLRPFATNEVIFCPAVISPRMASFTLHFREEPDGSMIAIERGAGPFLGFGLLSIALMICAIGLPWLSSPAQGGYWSTVGSLEGIAVCVALASGFIVWHASSYWRNIIVSKGLLTLVTMHNSTVRASSQYDIQMADCLQCRVSLRAFRGEDMTFDAIILVVCDQAVVLALCHCAEEMASYREVLAKKLGLEVRLTSLSISAPSTWIPWITHS